MVWTFLILSGLLTLLFHRSSGVQITNIKLYAVADTVKVTKGSKLEIPCMYFVDKPIGKDNKLQLEWLWTPGIGGKFLPIIQYDDSRRPRVKYHNGRAHLYLSNLHTGKCSLVIDQATNNDHGVYEIQLSLDGEQYLPSPMVQVQVLDISETEMPTPKTTRSNTPDLFGMIDEDVTTTITTSGIEGAKENQNAQMTKGKSFRALVNGPKGPERQQLNLENINPQIRRLLNHLQDLKRSGKLLSMKVAGGIILLMIIMGGIGGWIVKHCDWVWDSDKNERQQHGNREQQGKQ
ncbi:uncharacterized protein [Hyperolius riggenbachi]|uniref:uncharacterized protein isoform X2 n=1 Tax=Hyperolius riggenbachi TaxID=752182 RepID=UPI0035A27715